MVAGKGQYEGANPEDPAGYKAENVFLVPQEALFIDARNLGTLIDRAHRELTALIAILAISATSPDPDLQARITDPAVYRLFPEFRPFVIREHVQAAYRLPGARPVQHSALCLPERPSVVVRVLPDAHSCACQPS